MITNPSRVQSEHSIACDRRRSGVLCPASRLPSTPSWLCNWSLSSSQSQSFTTAGLPSRPFVFNSFSTQCSALPWCRSLLPCSINGRSQTPLCLCRPLRRHRRCRPPRRLAVETRAERPRTLKESVVEPPYPIFTQKPLNLELMRRSCMQECDLLHHTGSKQHTHYNPLTFTWPRSTRLSLAHTAWPHRRYTAARRRFPEASASSVNLGKPSFPAWHQERPCKGPGWSTA